MTDSLPTHPASTEPVAWRVRRLSDDPEEWQLRPAGAALDFGNPKRWEIQPLYTRPAPIEPGVREKVAQAIHDWVREDAPLNQKMTWTPELNRALENRIIALLSSNTGEG